MCGWYSYAVGAENASLCPHPHYKIGAKMFGDRYNMTNFEYSYDYQQDGQGTNIIGNGNDVNNGATAESEG